MQRKAATVIALIVLGVLCILLWHQSQQPSRRAEPAIAAELRALSEVAAVEVIGPLGARLMVIHLRDWYLADDLTFMDRVQLEQMKVIRHLVREHGIKAVYSEGLSAESLPHLHLRVKLAKVADSPIAKQFNLEMGSPGRLLAAGEIDVLPLEDQGALTAAKPKVEADGVTAHYDDAKVEARYRAMVKNLPSEGIAVVVLGGTHDLGPYLPDSLYLRVTTRSYPGE